MGFLEAAQGKALAAVVEEVPPEEAVLATAGVLEAVVEAGMEVASAAAAEVA